MENLSKNTIVQINNMVDRYRELVDMIDAPEVLADHKLTARIDKEIKGLQEVVDTYSQLTALKQQLALRCNENSYSDDCRDSEVYDKIRQLSDSLLRQVVYFNSSQQSVMMFLSCRVKDDWRGELSKFMSAYIEFGKREGWIISQIESLKGQELGYRIVGHNVKTVLQQEIGTHEIHFKEGVLKIELIVIDDIDMPSEIVEEDIRVDIFRASGAGGQHVNTTDSAVRMTHKPTGIVVTCQDERSQIQNRRKAMDSLRTKVFNYYQQQYLSSINNHKRVIAKNIDLTQKIRKIDTINGVVTDIKTNKTIDLEKFFHGNLDMFLY